MVNKLAKMGLDEKIPILERGWREEIIIKGV
jgi:hypothetical protein